MVVTEAPVEAAAGAPSILAPDSGPAALLGTVGHVAVGKLFVVASLLFLVVSRVADALYGAERLDVGEVTLLDSFEGRIDLLHLLGDSYLFVIPAFLGLAIAVVPLQVGSPTVAFPRGAAAAFWGFFLSGGVLLASFFVENDGVVWEGGDGARLFFVGFGGVLVSLLLATICVLTTVLSLRTAGMTVDRVPMFSWGMFVAGTVWLVSLPVALAVVALNYLDLTYQSGLGAFGSLTWAFGPTMAFAIAFPLVGVLLDVVPVAAGARLRNRGVLLGAVALGAILTFAADQISAEATGGATFQDVLYVAGSVALVLPLLAILGGVADTLRRGKPKLSSPLLFGVLGFLLLLAAAVANGVRVIDNLDLTGTSADSAVTSAALVAGLLGVAGGVHHWSTKLFGSQLREGIGSVAALVLFVGGLLLAAPDLVSGFLDQGDGLRPALPIEDGVEALNAASALGAVVVLLGALLVILNLAVGRAGDEEGDVPADPWGGHTLEWATTSPPSPGGPGPIEPVTSAEPLLDTKGEEA
jgi:heme/copper-type cytochrome/quinol oxidase subunit 1